MWLAHILAGSILLWLGLRIILRPKRKTKFPGYPVTYSAAESRIAYERARSLDRADQLVKQLDSMAQAEAIKLANMQMGLDLNSQVALDAIAQAEKAKLLLIQVMRDSGCNESEIRAMLAQIEAAND